MRQGTTRIMSRGHVDFLPQATTSLDEWMTPGAHALNSPRIKPDAQVCRLLVSEQVGRLCSSSVDMPDVLDVYFGVQDLDGQIRGPLTRFAPLHGHCLPAPLGGVHVGIVMTKLLPPGIYAMNRVHLRDAAPRHRAGWALMAERLNTPGLSCNRRKMLAIGPLHSGALGLCCSIGPLVT
jgi:hypothetical protein